MFVFWRAVSGLDYWIGLLDSRKLPLAGNEHKYTEIRQHHTGKTWLFSIAPRPSPQSRRPDPPHVRVWLARLFPDSSIMVQVRAFVFAESDQKLESVILGTRLSKTGLEPKLSVPKTKSGTENLGSRLTTPCKCA